MIWMLGGTDDVPGGVFAHNTLNAVGAGLGAVTPPTPRQKCEASLMVAGMPVDAAINICRFLPGGSVARSASGSPAASPSPAPSLPDATAQVSPDLSVNRGGFPTGGVLIALAGIAAGLYLTYRVSKKGKRS